MVNDEINKGVVLLTIANAKYAFLEEDYTNPNLTSGILMIEEPIENLFMKEESEKDKYALFSNIKTMFYQTMWNFKFLMWIPVDVICITILMFLEIVT